MLEEIFKKYNCDKLRHHYHKVYEKDFASLRNENINILEVGIWKGTSHSTWHEYFPNAQIYGIDIFSRMKPEDVKILSEERVHWLKADTTHKETYDIVKEWGVQFDIIIDDGRHTPEANANTFINLIDFLKEDGSYYIEDVWPLDIMTEKEWNHRWIKSNRSRYNMENWNIMEKSLQNYKVERIDLRASSNILDSYILKIKKS